MIERIYQWTIAWAATPQAEWALFFLAFAESSFFPIPPDVLLIAMAVAEPKSAFFFAAICSLGSLLGGFFGYFLGKKGGRPILIRWFSNHTIARVEKLFNRYDAWAIAIAGFTPIPYKVFTLAAGAFLINFRTFAIASALGRAGRFFLVATLFYFWGAPIKAFIDEYFNYLSLGFVVLLVGGFLAFRFLKGRAHPLPNTQGQ